MALNVATFKTRAGTAGIFVLVMLMGILLNHWSFFLLLSVILIAVWWEYQQLVTRIDPGYANITPFHKLGVMLAGWCVLLYFTCDAFNLFGVPLPAIGMWLGITALFVLPIIELLFARQLEFKNIMHSAFGLIYISLSLGLLIWLRCYAMSMPGVHGWFDFNGFILPLGVILGVWINDTMAYLVGSFIGKTPFSRISPKKTWEGTAGGAILCIATMTLLGWAIGIYRVRDWLIISTLVAIFGVIGDLFESKLKRLAGVKDSGNIMPGHGGFLDRFDSMLVVTPFVWLYVYLFMP